MRTEMDAMRMDERQRLAWLQANRATLLVVGVTWLALIVSELFQDRVPGFLIAMVPVFALVRFGCYRFYIRHRG